MSNFARCFPVDDGLMMLCQHNNGSWIKFEIGGSNNAKSPSLPEKEDEDYANEEKD